jgi:hypothetical protein
LWIIYARLTTLLLGVHNYPIARIRKGANISGVHQQALDLARTMDHSRSEALTRHNLGNSYRPIGEPGTAADHFRRALPVFQRTGDRHFQAQTLQDLGDVQHDLRETIAARILATSTGDLRRTRRSAGRRTASPPAGDRTPSDRTFLILWAPAARAFRPARAAEMALARRIRMVLGRRVRSPAPAQQSNTDQQMSFRNRWSPSTSSRIASGIWAR